MTIGGEGDTLRAVSYHAVTRYVQRVLDVRLPISEAETGARACAEAHCAAADTALDVVRRAILSRDVIAAIAMGRGLVRIDGGARVLVCDSIIVTVMGPKAERKHKPRRVRRLGKTEGRKKAHKFQRRRRRVGTEVVS